jgi:uncharacterized protein (DUF1684 family)
MKNRITFLILFISASSFAQKNLEEITKANQEYRTELNAQYKDSLHSPLKREARLKFEAFPFYPIDSNYFVVAKFERIEKGKKFKMKTSTSRKPEYKVFGRASFTINDSIHELMIYQNTKLVTREGYEDYLFLPFNDYTNGNETYGGGRYLDVRIPERNTIILDFNKAYNPYCAYTYGYSCPVPPKENSLNIEIKAGIKYEAKED